MRPRSPPPARNCGHGYRAVYATPGRAARRKEVFLMSEGGSATPRKRVEARDAVVIRFAGDSGDGMQATGTQFTAESAIAGNDIATLPDFPAEIRAPAGTLAGVSAFQLNFSSGEVFTPGDDLDVLVAMNPAALRTNLEDLKQGGILIVDQE